MLSRPFSRWCWITVAAAAGACGGGESIAPSNQPPAKVEAVSDLVRSGSVGAAITDGLVVKVTDAAGRPVQGANVAFAVEPVRRAVATSLTGY